MTAVNNLESLVAEVEKLDEAPCMEHVPAIDDLAKAVNGTRDKFLGAMRDDFNTAAAIGALFELARDVHSFAGGLAHMDSGKQRKSLPVLREAYQVFLELGGGILGIVDTKTTIAHGDELVGDLIELLIDVRKRARDARDWATADFIRDELENLGIRLEDSPLGTRWKL